MTAMFFLEAAVNAKVDDILAFLQNDNEIIPPYNHFTDRPDGFDMTVNFHSERKGNTISIYTKIYTTKPGRLYPRCYEDLADGPGNEIIRFEVTRLTDNRSLIKGLYADDNPQIALMFWKRWTRLGVAFDAKFVVDAQSQLDELEAQFGEQWGWRESSSAILGNKSRVYGRIPKQTEASSEGVKESMEANSNLTIQGSILRELYAAFSRGEPLVGINALSEALGKTENEIYEVLVNLNKLGHATAVTNDSYKVLPEGIIYTESNKLASEALISENKIIRVKMLDELAMLHERYKGSQALQAQNIADSINSNVYVVLNNADVLEYLGLITPYLIGDFKITDRGLLDVKKSRERQALSQEFKRISELEPHRRGREFQEFFAKLASHEGWKQEISIKTSNEEIDVIIYHNREFFLVECKWEKSPLETSAVRDFYGKLDTRDEVKGIIVSMSGFAAGAIEFVQSQAGKKIILLFGPGDIRSVLNSDIELEALINEKYRQFVTRKIVLFN